MHSQKTNKTNYLAKTKNIIIGVMLKDLGVKALRAFDNIVFKTKKNISPGRNNPRKHRQK
jgi:hypothetical protein